MRWGWGDANKTFLLIIWRFFFFVFYSCVWLHRQFASGTLTNVHEHLVTLTFTHTRKTLRHTQRNRRVRLINEEGRRMRLILKGSWSSAWLSIDFMACLSRSASWNVNFFQSISRCCCWWMLNGCGFQTGGGFTRLKNGNPFWFI